MILRYSLDSLEVHFLQVLQTVKLRGRLPRQKILIKA